MCSCVETIQHTKIVKARKDYEDSCKWFILEVLQDLRSGWGGPKLTFKEWRLIAESIRDNWAIKKGQLHEHSVLKMDGMIYSWRSKPGLSDLCAKHELFGDC